MPRGSRIPRLPSIEYPTGRMDQVAVFRLFDLEVSFPRALDICLCDFVPVDRYFDFLDMRVDRAARQVDENPVDAFTGKLLRGTYGGEDGILRGFHVDHGLPLRTPADACCATPITRIPPSALA